MEAPPFINLQDLEDIRSFMQTSGGHIVLGDAPFRAARRRWRTPRAISALMLRETVTTYGRSPGGYIWAILEPVAAIALLSFAFSMAFRAPSLGISFPMFYATGYLPFILFLDVANKTATSIRFSRPLLNFAALTWFDVVLARFLLNLCTHLATTTVVIVGLVSFFETRIILDAPRVAAALGTVALLAGGVGALNAYAFLAFPAWERIWQILTRPLFIVSGVFFLFEDLPQEVQTFLWYNPLFHVTGEMRRGFYPTYVGDYVSLEFVTIVGLGLGVFGLLLLHRNADGLIHK